MTGAEAVLGAAGAAELRAAIAGAVLLPGTSAYEAVRRPALGRFHDVFPEVIVRCAAPADVAAAIAVAGRRGLELAVRSGGHCFAGRSSSGGMLVDVGPMDAIAVDGDGGVVAAGAGARLGSVYDALEPHGLTVAAGCGPTVGIAGLALGGGLGILGRRHGLTSDQLVAAEVVLADGRIVACDEHRHPDLFWALRGAGGCQFGVVTRLVLRTLPAPPATTVHLRWPVAHVAGVLDAWQAWAPAAPVEVAVSLLVTAGADPGRAPVAHAFGAVLGTRAQAAALLEPLVARAGAEPASASLRELPYRQAKRVLADEGPGEEPAEAAHGFSRSEFFRRLVPREAVAALVEHMAADRVEGQTRSLDFSPWGGAYNRVPEDATAFAHRAESFVLKHDVAVRPDAAPAQRRAAQDWLARSWALVHPFGSGRVYPNFPDPALEDWRAAYHAGNAGRLARIKAAYDPGDVFRGPQQLSAGPAGA